LALVHGTIDKTRHVIEADGHMVEVDLYGGNLDGLVIAEVEFSSEREARIFTPPGGVTQMHYRVQR
jgi:CYTH domain-containing protein